MKKEIIYTVQQQNFINKLEEAEKKEEWLELREEEN